MKSHNLVFTTLGCKLWWKTFFVCLEDIFSKSDNVKVLVAKKARELMNYSGQLASLGIFNILMSNGAIEVYMYIMCVSACESF